MNHNKTNMGEEAGLNSFPEGKKSQELHSGGGGVVVKAVQQPKKYASLVA